MGGKTYNRCLQPFRVLDVDGLDVRVKPVLCALFVITSAADTDTEAVWDTLDALLPDLLVQLGVDADIFGSLFFLIRKVLIETRDSRVCEFGGWGERTIAL